MFLSYLHFYVSAHLLGFRQQLRSALSRLHDNSAFSSWLLSTNSLDLSLTAVAQKIEADAVALFCVDDLIESITKSDEIQLVEVTLKDAVLHPLAEIFERFEDPATAFIVLNIVRDYNKHSRSLDLRNSSSVFPKAFSLQPTALPYFSL